MSVETMEKESVVAAVPAGYAAERDLYESVSAYELQAEMMEVEDDAGYAVAAEFGRTLKQQLARVTEFFKPMKTAAYNAHTEICDKEKAMRAPVDRALATVKQVMGAYSQKVERERLRIEAEAKRIAQEEAARKLAEAAALESAGDTQAADMAMSEAQMAERFSSTVAVDIAPPRAVGTSVGKDWRITGIDDQAVPITLNGFMLRPVDDKALLRLIRASKGNIQIPGVTYVEEAKISIRK